MKLLLLTDYDTKRPVMINLDTVNYIREVRSTKPPATPSYPEYHTVFYYGQTFVRVNGRIEDVMRRYK